MEVAALGCWCLGPVVLLLHVGLFLLRRDVSLRPTRLAWLLALPLLPRVLLLLFGNEISLWEIGPLGGVGLLAWLLLVVRMNWLVRASPQQLRTQIDTACRGLFLARHEPEPGRFTLGNAAEFRLQLRSLSAGIQLVTLDRSPSSGKLTLFVNWLARQYPGPVPRMRINLKGGSS